MEMDAQSEKLIARLPLWLRLVGAVFFIGSLMLAARIVWEQTVWTWEQGPQMVGFSLAHGYGAPLLLFPFFLFIWTIAVLGLTLGTKIKNKRMKIAPMRWVVLGLAILIFVLPGLPESFWERVFIRQMSASPRAGDLLVDAAYGGDLGTVRGFLSHGVPVNAIHHADWRTAVHGAAVKGDTRILRYLAANGADFNALDRCGDSPLELAASKGNREAAEFLIERGAKRIRGNDEQRTKCNDDQVEDSIREFNRAEGIGRPPS